jgi:hypothetical protein
MADSEDEDDEAMPAPTVRHRPEEDGAIGALSERLEQAARSAMGRLRSIRTEQEQAEQRSEADAEQADATVLEEGSDEDA